MGTYKIKSLDELDKSHYRRCIKQLKEWGAPLDNWYCTEIIDVKEDDEDAPLSECELCGCQKVRYEHVMEHDQYFEPVIVGCICAGIMEGDILKAQERDRLMRNRSRRRKRFVERGWDNHLGVRYRDHKGKRALLIKQEDGYAVRVNMKTITKYKGKRITDTLTAAYAAFNLLDPKENILCGKSQ